jgi:trimeric autotransporter adhesin
MKIFSAFLITVLSIFLAACGGDDDKKKPTIVLVTPSTVTVKVGMTQTFTANVVGSSNSAVTWKVNETGGGTITSAGLYTAPATAGTYSVTATSVSDAKASATATITVAALDKAMVRVFHASPNAPKVNLWVNDAIAASGLDYQKSTGYLSLNEGTYKIAVEGIIPSGNAVVIGPVNLPLAGKTNYDVIAVNPVATIAPVILEDKGSLMDATKVRVRVAHLASAAPEVKVFVTAPGADLVGATALGSIAFKSVLGPVEVAAGNYQIRVTLMNNTVVFDSGTVALAAGKNLLVGAVPNVGTGTSPISLAVLDGPDVAVIYDKSAGAKLRVVHASADAPEVDVLANDGTTPAVPKLAFPNATDYLSLPAATYNFKVVATGTLTPAVIDEDVPLANGAQYTLLAVGTLSPKTIEPLLLTDNNRVVATEAKVRLVHASTLAGNVDIYVVAKDASIANKTPAFANIPFKADTGYVSLGAGDYDVVITPAGQPGTVAIKATLKFVAGGIYTAIARDGANLTTPLSVIGLDGLGAK